MKRGKLRQIYPHIQKTKEKRKGQKSGCDYIEICKIHTDLNVADPLTKPLSQAKHDHTLVLFGC